MHGFQAFGHIALKVADLDAMAHFWRDQVGLQEMDRLVTDGKPWLIYLRITDTQFLELITGATTAEAPPESHVGVTHICLTVGLPEAVAHITGAHSGEGELLLRSLEGTIVHLADIGYWTMALAGGLIRPETVSQKYRRPISL